MASNVWRRYCSVADAEERLATMISPPKTPVRSADDRDADHHHRRRQHARQRPGSGSGWIAWASSASISSETTIVPDLGGDAGAGEAGQDDRADQRAQLAEDRDGDDVGDAVDRAVLAAAIGAICSARIAPMQKSTSMTIGMLLTPTRTICAQRFRHPSRRPRR